MRKIVLILLAGVLMLSAVQWEIEQVTHEEDKWSLYPLLVLDEAGQPKVLFSQNGVENKLIVASYETEAWSFEEVAVLNEGMQSYYSMDVDSERNTFVAYSDLIGEQNSDIFIASDTQGAFTSVNVTDDELFQAAPVLKVDILDVPHIIYAQAAAPDDEIQIRHGWLDTEGFRSEPVTENLYQGGHPGYDLVFDPLNQPHIFYVGDDGYLWHAYPGEVIPWEFEPLNDMSSEWPSAVADPLGSFHVAYDVGGNDIHYITNMSGSWQDEEVVTLGGADGGNQEPSLAMEIVYGNFLGIGSPHVVYRHADADWYYDLYYAGKPAGSWVEEPILSTPGKNEWVGSGHYFAIDVQNYGHVVYAADEDDGFVAQIFYAKTKEPLAGSAVEEHPVASCPFNLEVRGSSLHLSLSYASSISLDLYDACGRLLDHLASGIYPEGEHSISINSTGLSAGVYFVRVEINGQLASVKFVLTR